MTTRMYNIHEIFSPRFDRPSGRSFTKKFLPSGRSFTKNFLPSGRSFTKKCLPSVQQEKHLTGGCSKGSDRLTCPAQPGHGGKRRDSPEERVSSAITDLMQMIDHKPNNQIETQYFDITFGTLEWLGAAMKC